MDSRYKTTLCLHYAKHGKCEAGSNCHFAHSNRELRSFENVLYKAQLCTAYEQGGVCQMGDDCLFAHGENELRSDDVTISSHSPNQSQINHLIIGPDSENDPGRTENDKRGGFKSALCMHFSKHGSCHMGVKCTFAHGKEDLINVKAPDTNDPKYKTKLCLRFAQDNFCPSGDFCVFAHGESELRGATDESTKRSPLYKSTLCHNFSTLGVCPSGRNCAFAHGRYELRPAGFDGDFDAKIQENPKWKCSLCKIFQQNGHCNKVNCDFAHGDSELRTESPENPRILRSNYKTVMCHNWTTHGHCYHEETCTFAHGEEELQKFSGGRDVASALKLIRGGATVNPVMRNKRPGTAGMSQNGGNSGMMASQPQPMSFQSVPSVSNEQKLFAEFLEFKKFKEQTENTGVFNNNLHSRLGHMGQQSQSQSSNAMIMSSGPGYEPIKVLNNVTGRQVAVTELMANRGGLGSGRNSNGGFGSGGGGRMSTPRNRSSNGFGMSSMNDNFSSQAQQEMDYF